eukprot:scaffold2621_cov164-Ochromonas_danica.AAC.4
MVMIAKIENLANLVLTNLPIKQQTRNPKKLQRQQGLIQTNGCILSVKNDSPAHNGSCLCTNFHIGKKTAIRLEKCANRIIESISTLKPSSCPTNGLDIDDDLCELLNLVALLLNTFRCVNTSALALFESCCQVIYEIILDFSSPNNPDFYNKRHDLYLCLTGSIVPLGINALNSIQQRLEKNSQPLPNEGSNILSTIAEMLRNLMRCQECWKDHEQMLCKQLLTLPTNCPLALSQLNMSLDSLHARQLEINATISLQNDRILSDLRHVLDGIWRNAGIIPHIHPFGSRISALGDLGSDLDVCLTFSEGYGDRSAVVPVFMDNRSKGVIPNYRCMKTTSVLKDIRRELRGSRHFQFMDVIFWSRIPIITFKHVATGVEIDLCVGNELGCQNTLLLKAYGEADARLYKLLLAVKQWASRRYISNAKSGLLSSFSWCLLALYAAKCHFAFRLPEFSLTHYAVERLKRASEEIAFHTEGHEMFHLQQTSLDQSSDNVTAGELLLHFFTYFGCEDEQNFSYLTGTISLLDGTAPSSAHIGSHDTVHSDAEDNNIEDDDNDSSNASSDEGENEAEHVIIAALTRKRSTRPRPWCIKIEDCFDKRDLGKVVDSFFHQNYFIGEIHRGMTILAIEGCTRMSEAWSCVCEVNLSLPEGGSFAHSLSAKFVEGMVIFNQFVPF